MANPCGFWERVLTELSKKPKLSDEPEKYIPNIIEKMNEDWDKKTVTIFIKKDEIIKSNEIFFLGEIFGTKKYNVGLSEEKGEYFVWILFWNVVFPQIEVPQKEEGGKHC